MSAHIRNALVTPRGSRRYGAVLTLVLVSLVFQMAAPDRPGFRLAAAVLQIGTLALAVHASDVHGRDGPFVTAVVALGLAAVIVSIATGGETERVISTATSAAVTALTLGTIGLGVIVGIRAEGSVNLHAVVGVVCVYLLIGLLFSYFYGTIAVVGHEDLFAQGTDGDHQDQLYFSFITQTTVGYGDYTPAGHLARSLAAVEALIGQIYLVTIVALIVSNLRPRRRGSAEPEA